MTREEWLRVKYITAEALEQPEAERETYVARACHEQRMLEADIRSLLASALKASSLYETPGFASAPAALSVATRPAAMPPGARVGSYRIVREIGRGGMGTVFLAERADEAYRQQVALKVAHEVRSPDAFVRFREERQILATLDHPNIARLLDGGTTDDGWPYLVMEYVEGVPVDEYVASERLSIEERVRLFRVICDAADYAHRHLIVHRDIKPSNILVRRGVPKLLDFGIAQLLDPNPAPPDPYGAGAELQRLTPEYASPEQLQRLAVTTATDVYALGVLLYRLLTDRSPYRLDDPQPHALARAICEIAPAPPSAVAGTRQARRRLAGDLDTIALTALRKDPAARYSSAGRLADDIDRYLAGLPLLAHGRGAVYRARKFVGRHRVGALAAALVVLSLVGGLVSVAWQARETERQRLRAQQNFDDVRRLANGLVFDINDGIESIPGTISTRRLLISRALEYLDRLAAEARDDVGLQRELAQSYEKLGNVLGRLYAANVGDTGAALAAYRKALAVRRQLADLAPADPRVQAEMWTSQLNIGNVLRDTADTEGALALHTSAGRALDAQLRNQTNNPQFVRAAAQAASTLSLTYVQAGRLDPALESVRRAVTLQRQLLDADRGNATLQNELATVLGRAGQIALKRGDLSAARSLVGESFELATGLVAAQPGNPAFRRRLSNTHSHFAQLLIREGKAAEAWPHQQMALALRQTLVDQNPGDKQASIDLMVSEIETGLVLARRRDFAAAGAHYRAAIARAESLVGADASCVYCRLSLATALTRAAMAMHERARFREGEPLAARAAALMERAVDADPIDVRPRFELAMVYQTLGQPRKSLDLLAALSRAGRRAGGPLDDDEPRIMVALEQAIAAGR